MVTHALSLPSLDAEGWLRRVEERYGGQPAEVIGRALDYLVDRGADLAVDSGTPLAKHALGGARQLAEMGFDAETVAAALLAGLPEAALEAEQLTREFGPTLAALATGAARLNRMDALFSELGGEGDQSEALRQMLLAMTDDIRVVLIKLAERVQTLRELAALDEAQRRRAAHDVRELYAPLANRLGVWQFKWELEDLACRYEEPDTYREIARRLDERRIGREGYIEQVIAQLKRELTQAGLREFQIVGRPKHIASILAKMRKKALSFEEVYDVRATRILVRDVKDCYHALGLVHSLWQPIPGQFDDYIARPKGNGYRSLHTAVIGPEGKALEVQIRTYEMHREAELGVAAHWRYKEGHKDTGLSEKIAWLRQILAWRQELADSADLAQHFKNELFQEEVFVLTPQGRVVALVQGATPIDFAYAVHSELGHRCRGAKLDGVLVPLDTPLKNGQRVEILTVKEGGPSRDWLNPHLGFIRSSRARAKVRQWFKQLDHDSHVQDGRDLLERELHRLGLSNVNLERLANRLKYPKPEDLCAALGRGDIGSGQLARSLQDEFLPPPEKPLVVAPKSTSTPSGVLVEGEANLLTQLAGCCKPAPPERIVGYTTRGRGVTIHRHDCRVIRNLPAERRLRADWGQAGKDMFAVDVSVSAHDRQGLLKDLTEILSQERINVVRLNTQIQDDSARMDFTLEVQGVDQLTRFLSRAANVRGVFQARRK